MDEIETLASTTGPVKSVERATLGKVEAENVAAWLGQLEESSKGFLILSRSDIINFIVREHKPELSPREMQQIRIQHYDPIRHLNWITPRLKEALEKNDTDAVQSLQGEIRSIELSTIARAKEIYNVADSDNLPAPLKRRSRKAKKNDAENETKLVSFDEIPDTISEG